jgi:hypothetical protein
VLARSAPPRRRWWFGVVAVTVLSAAGLLLILRPTGSEWTARGGGPTPVIQLRCDGAPGECRSGDRLRFELLGEAPARYFAAFARRPDGAVIWYIPSEPDGSSVDLEAERDRMVGRQVVLGADHPPGRYEVTVIFSQRGFNRDAIRRALTSGPDPELTLRRLPLVIR